MRAGAPAQIPALNGLRAVAVLIVFAGHAALPLPVRGSVGVTIFFFLSGYLITTLLRREYDRYERIAVGEFYLRRVLRIAPPLLVALAGAAALSLTGVMGAGMTPMGLLSGATYWTNYYIIGAGREGLPAGMNALWSLAVEEHYYLVFPLLYLGLRRFLPDRRRQAGVLVAICLTILAWRTVLVLGAASYDRVYLATDTRADAILWGAVAAVLVNPVLGDVRLPARPWRWAAVVIAAAVAFCAVPWLPDPVAQSVGYTVQSLLLFAVFLPLVAGVAGPVNRLLDWRPVAYLGVLSYAFYLVHRPLLELAHRWVGGPKPLWLAVALLATIGLSLSIRVLVERPCEALRRRFRPGSTTVAGRSAPQVLRQLLGLVQQRRRQTP